MSRRDTIIIALLVNAGLLALLFMLAVNDDDGTVSDRPEILSAVVQPSAKPIATARAPTPVVPEKVVQDEVDSFLKELAAEDLSRPVLIDDEGYFEMRQEEILPVAATARKQEEPRSIDGGAFVEVTVKRGDALEKIARNNGTTVEAIKKANQMTTSKLSIGQVLKVPVGAKAVEELTQKPVQPVAQSTPKEPPKKPVGATEPQYYTIKSGDNPWKIAKQHNVKFDDLLRLNNLDEERAKNLKIGDKVRVK